MNNLKRFLDVTGCDNRLPVKCDTSDFLLKAFIMTIKPQHFVTSYIVSTHLRLDMNCMA